MSKHNKELPEHVVGTIHAHELPKNQELAESHADVDAEQPHYHPKGSSWREYSKAQQFTSDPG